MAKRCLCYSEEAWYHSKKKMIYLILKYEWPFQQHQHHWILFVLLFNAYRLIITAEVRPAPHMDNLVSIYKSMEVASGINIFVTQNTSSTKLSGEQCKLYVGITQLVLEQIISCRTWKTSTHIDAYALNFLCMWAINHQE